MCCQTGEGLGSMHPQSLTYPCGTYPGTTKLSGSEIRNETQFTTALTIHFIFHPGMLVGVSCAIPKKWFLCEYFLNSLENWVIPSDIHVSILYFNWARILGHYQSVSSRECNNVQISQTHPIFKHTMKMIHTCRPEKLSRKTAGSDFENALNRPNQNLYFYIKGNIVNKWMLSVLLQWIHKI
jgi:hypothetical protein